MRTTKLSGGKKAWNLFFGNYETFRTFWYHFFEYQLITARLTLGRQFSTMRFFRQWFIVQFYIFSLKILLWKIGGEVPMSKHNFIFPNCKITIFKLFTSEQQCIPFHFQLVSLFPNVLVSTKNCCQNSLFCR